MTQTDFCRTSNLKLRKDDFESIQFLSVVYCAARMNISARAAIAAAAKIQSTRFASLLPSPLTLPTLPTEERFATAHGVAESW
jgi:hypothetical protein